MWVAELLQMIIGIREAPEAYKLLRDFFGTPVAIAIFAGLPVLFVVVVAYLFLG